MSSQLAPPLSIHLCACSSARFAILLFVPLPSQNWKPSTCSLDINSPIRDFSRYETSLVHAAVTDTALQPGSVEIYVS